MTERLVDVLDRNGAVIHTYPISLAAPSEIADDAAYITKALEEAGHRGLVADTELAGLSARIHVSRGGQMAPYGDDRASASATKANVEQTIRDRAFLLWKQDGSPEGSADKYWHRALDEHLRERAYALWEQAGRPEGRADEYWRRALDFEAQ
jgi:Protein of unknown function (DUF2934)